MTDPVRVYVNARAVDAAAGGTILDAVRAYDPAIAELVAAGTRALTDSRGLPLAPESPAYTGAIVRVVSARRRDDAEAG